MTCYLEGELSREYVKELDLQCFRDKPDSTQNKFELIAAVDDFSKATRSILRKLPKPTEDWYVCYICGDLLEDPVTFPCGHTFSRYCMLDVEKQWNCPKCGQLYSLDTITRLKTNVLIKCMLERFRTKTLQFQELRRTGMEHFKNGQLFEAIEIHAKALKIDPSTSSVITSGHLCSALLQYGQPLVALDYANHIVKSWPSLAKGYFQKAEALAALERSTDAAKYLLLAYVLNSNDIRAKNFAVQFLGGCAKSAPSEHLRCRRDSSCTNHHFQNFFKKKHSYYAEIGNDDSSDVAMCGTDSKSNLMYCSENSETQTLDGAYHLHKIFSDIMHDDLQKFKCPRVYKAKDVSLHEKADFECPLCIRLLMKPVTTPCGHTFCRSCIMRWFDYQPTCPLCKMSLMDYIAERIFAVTELVEYVIKASLPKDSDERLKLHFEEIEEFTNTGKVGQHTIPLFICTVGFPDVPCPLHIFEPRYRYMVRQCIEFGSNQFGMCAVVGDNEDGIASVGTLLQIREVEYLPDGRSVLDTVGIKRFRVLNKGMRDGYNIGTVEYLQDIPINENQLEEVTYYHDTVRKNFGDWFEQLAVERKSCILSRLGEMPQLEENCLFCPNGPAWFWWVLAILPLGAKLQLRILSMTSLLERLKVLNILMGFCHRKRTERQ